MADESRALPSQMCKDVSCEAKSRMREFVVKTQAHVSKV